MCISRKRSSRSTSRRSRSVAFESDEVEVDVEVGGHASPDRVLSRHASVVTARARRRARDGVASGGAGGSARTCHSASEHTSHDPAPPRPSTVGRQATGPTATRPTAEPHDATADMQPRLRPGAQHSHRSKSDYEKPLVERRHRTLIHREPPMQLSNEERSVPLPLLLSITIKRETRLAPPLMRSLQSSHKRRLPPGCGSQELKSSACDRESHYMPKERASAAKDLPWLKLAWFSISALAS